jgi:hypothetical protein
VRPGAYDRAKRQRNADARLAATLRDVAGDHMDAYVALLLRRAATRIEALGAELGRAKQEGRGR